MKRTRRHKKEEDGENERKRTKCGQSMDHLGFTPQMSTEGRVEKAQRVSGSTASGPCHSALLYSCLQRDGKGRGEERGTIYIHYICSVTEPHILVQTDHVVYKVHYYSIGVVRIWIASHTQRTCIRTGFHS